MSAAAVLFAAVACNKEETTDNTGNDDNTGGGATATPEIVVATTGFEVNCESNTLTVEYSVTNPVEDGVLSASVDVDWVSAVVGDEAVTLTVDANDTGEDRSATVTLSYEGASDVSLTVAQVIPVISASSEVSVTYEGGTTTVSYSVSNPVEGETLSAVVDADWVSAVVGDDVVTLTVSENTDYSSRSATVTLSYAYAQDVTVSVVQDAASYPATYDDFIGTWTVNDGSTTGTIVISQNVANESYTIDGWQFAETGVDATDLGFNETGSIAFTATYDSDNNALVLSTAEFGTYTTEYEGIGTLTGDVWLLGLINYGGSESIVTTSSGYGYDLATMTITSEGNATMTGGTVELATGASYEIIGAEYIYSITSPAAYNGYYLSWSDPAGIYFPSTLTKVSSGTASTSSVKSAEIAAPVMGNNSVKAL